MNADGENKIGFTGQERDEESRFIVMGVRQYDPKTGRFLSIDPFFEKFPSQSPYQYAYNNPISFKDPTGFEPESEKGGEDRMQWSITKEDISFSQLMLNLATLSINQDGNIDTGPGSHDGWELSWNQIQNYFLKQYGGGGGGGSPLSSDVATYADRMVIYDYDDIMLSNALYKLKKAIGAQPKPGDEPKTGKKDSDNGIESALDVISKHGGKKMVDALRKILRFATFIPGNDIYEEYIKYKPDYSNESEFLQGLSRHHVSEGMGSDGSCYTDPIPMIYLAYELLGNNKLSPFKYTYTTSNFWDMFSGQQHNYYSEVWFVLAHEIWHTVTSFSPFTRFLNNEFWANAFQKYIFDNKNSSKGWKLN